MVTPNKKKDVSREKNGRFKGNIGKSPKKKSGGGPALNFHDTLQENDITMDLEKLFTEYTGEILDDSLRAFLNESEDIDINKISQSEQEQINELERQRNEELEKIQDKEKNDAQVKAIESQYEARKYVLLNRFRALKVDRLARLSQLKGQYFSSLIHKQKQGAERKKFYANMRRFMGLFSQNISLVVSFFYGLANAFLDINWASLRWFGFPKGILIARRISGGFLYFLNRLVRLFSFIFGISKSGSSFWGKFPFFVRFPHFVFTKALLFRYNVQFFRFFRRYIFFGAHYQEYKGQNLSYPSIENLIAGFQDFFTSAFDFKTYKAIFARLVLLYDIFKLLLSFFFSFLALILQENSFSVWSSYLRGSLSGAFDMRIFFSDLNDLLVFLRKYIAGFSEPGEEEKCNEPSEKEKGGATGEKNNNNNSSQPEEGENKTFDAAQNGNKKRNAEVPAGEQAIPAKLRKGGLERGQNSLALWRPIDKRFNDVVNVLEGLLQSEKKIIFKTAKGVLYANIGKFHVSFNFGLFADQVQSAFEIMFNLYKEKAVHDAGEFFLNLGEEKRSFLHSLASTFLRQIQSLFPWPADLRSGFLQLAKGLGGTVPAVQ